MKIAILTNYGLESPGGGVRVYTKNLVSRLYKKGVAIKVISRIGTNSKWEKNIPTNKFFYTFKALKYFNVTGPDIILAQGGWFAAIPAMVYKLKNSNVNVAYVYHTYYDVPKGFTSKITRHIEQLLMSFVLSKFDVVFFVSNGLKNNVEETGALRVFPHWKVLYGAPTVEEPAIEEIAKFRDKFKISHNKFYLLAHGLTAFPVKAQGAKLLIETLSHLPDNVMLILTRRGGLMKELKNYAEILNVSKRVIFTGDLKNPHVATVVSDVYTHITYGEGLPLALLEVMKIGKPIIASKVGGIPEAIRHPKEGILINNTTAELRSSIETLIYNPKLRKKMSIISRRAVEKRFSWEKTARNILNLINRMTERL